MEDDTLTHVQPLLVHAHQCEACDLFSDSEQMHGRETLRGLFECPHCHHKGALNVKIVEEALLNRSFNTGV